VLTPPKQLRTRIRSLDRSSGRRNYKAKILTTLGRIPDSARTYPVATGIHPFLSIYVHERAGIYPYLHLPSMVPIPARPPDWSTRERFIMTRHVICIHRSRRIYKHTSCTIGIERANCCTTRHELRSISSPTLITRMRKPLSLPCFGPKEIPFCDC
jgi:hypothetical protein